MYVVRVVGSEGQLIFKAFGARPDAVEYLLGASQVIEDYGLGAVSMLFEVPGEDDARKAVDAVKAGHAIVLDRIPAT